MKIYVKKIHLKRWVKVSLILIIYVTTVLTIANIYCDRIAELNNVAEVENYIGE